MGEGEDEPGELPPSANHTPKINHRSKLPGYASISKLYHKICVCFFHIVSVRNMLTRPVSPKLAFWCSRQILLLLFVDKSSDRFQNLSDRWNFSQSMSDGLALFRTLYSVRVVYQDLISAVVLRRDKYDRGVSPDSLDETRVRIDVTDTTDTEVDDDYKRKRQYLGATCSIVFKEFYKWAGRTFAF